MGIMDGVNAVITGVERVREVSQKIHDADLQNAIADLTLTLAKAKGEMAEVVSRNAELQEALNELRSQAEVRANVEFKNGLYFLKEEMPGYSKGPFCTRCLDCDGKLVTLRGPGWVHGEKGGPGALLAKDGTGWICPECRRSNRM